MLTTYENTAEAARMNGSVRHTNGMTILEVIVAIALLGVVAATAVPSLSVMVESSRIRGDGLAAVAYVRSIRATGVARNRAVRLVATAGAASLSMEVQSAGVWTSTGNTQALERTTVFSVSSGSAFTFQPQGTTGGAGTLVLRSAGGRTIVLSVTPLGSVVLS